MWELEDCTGDVAGLLARVKPWLLRRHATNNKVLGLLEGSMPIEFAGVVRKRDGTVGMVAVWTAAGAVVVRAVVVSAVEEMGQVGEIARVLVEGLPGSLREEAQGDKGGAVGMRGAAMAVAERLAEGRPGKRVRVRTRLGVYECREVLEHAVPEGRQRRAERGDIERVASMALAFAGEIGEPMSAEWAKEYAERAIEEQRSYLWELAGGEVVSLAHTSGATPEGIRVNAVYTPPEHRGKGYARGNVGALTRRLLAGGKPVVFLFTNLENATSNGVYRRLGYVQVDESAHCVVE